MREIRTSGSARGAARKGRPYRDPPPEMPYQLLISRVIRSRPAHLYSTNACYDAILRTSVRHLTIPHDTAILFCRVNGLRSSL